MSQSQVAKPVAAPLPMLTSADVAATLNVSTQTVLRMAKDGQMPAPLVLRSRGRLRGAMLRWDPVAIDQFARGKWKPAGVAP